MTTQTSPKKDAPKGIAWIDYCPQCGNTKTAYLVDYPPGKTGRRKCEMCNGWVMYSDLKEES